MIGLPIFKPTITRISSVETSEDGIGRCPTALEVDSDEIVNISIFDMTNLRIKLSNKANLETGGSVWKASWLLSHYFAIDPSIVHNKVVFELGSGSGLCGLSTAFFGARKIFLTDLPWIFMSKFLYYSKM